MMSERDVISLANRVGACAVGLAFAGRDDPECLQQLIDMAGGRRPLLTQARARLQELDTVDEPVRRRADALLQAAAWKLPATDGDGASGPLVTSS